MQNKLFKRETSILLESEKTRKKMDPDNAMLFLNASATIGFSKIPHYNDETNYWILEKLKLLPNFIDL